MQFPPPDGPGFEIPSVVEELWCEFLAWKTGGSGGRTDSLFVMVFLGVIEIKVVILLCTLSKSIMIHIFIYIHIVSNIRFRLEYSKVFVVTHYRWFEHI